jgi:hypothetical protein
MQTMSWLQSERNLPMIDRMVLSGVSSSEP